MPDLNDILLECRWRRRHSMNHPSLYEFIAPLACDAPPGILMLGLADLCGVMRVSGTGCDVLASGSCLARHRVSRRRRIKDEDALNIANTNAAIDGCLILYNSQPESGFGFGFRLNDFRRMLTVVNGHLIVI